MFSDGTFSLNGGIVTLEFIIHEGKPKLCRFWHAANCWQQRSRSKPTTQAQTPDSLHPPQVFLLPDLPSSLILLNHVQPCRCPAMLYKHQLSLCLVRLVRLWYVSWCRALGLRGDMKSGTSLQGTVIYSVRIKSIMNVCVIDQENTLKHSHRKAE